MSIEKSAIRITELDMLSIKENLKAYLRGQDEFQDYDFDGSGLNILLDILAYNTFYMGYYLNMVGNEMFLDSAQLRSSLVSHAKLMNYVPGSKQGAISRLNITATPSATEDQAATTVTLGKYTRLLGQDIDGVNYPFVTLNANTAVKVGGSFSWSNVYIKQGEVVSLQFLMEPTNTKRRFEIPSDSVDTTTLQILVQDSASNATVTNYTAATDITELTANSAVYFVEENENAYYSFYFGDGVIGKRPKNGNIITATYIDTVGSQANNISQFNMIDPIGGKYTDNVTITSAQKSYGAIDKEEIESVRFRAPYFLTTQNRMVNINDYETLLLKDFNTIDSVSVWGGDENDPVIYGKVFISIKTKGNYYLTNFEKERIKTTLIRNRNVKTVTPEIVDPNYTYFLIQGKVYYDPSLTSYSADEIASLVRAAVQDYTSQELNSFKSTFRKSTLQRYIETADKSITGSDVDIVLQKRIAIDTSQAKTYPIKFNTPIAKTITGVRISTFPEIKVQDASGILRNCFIEEVPEAATGIDHITIKNYGSNYLTPPTVTIVGDGSGALATAAVVSGRIDSIKIVNPGTNYSSAIVEIEGGDGSGAQAVAVLQSKIGTLRLFYYADTREKVVINSAIGTIDYDSGAITLNSVRIREVVENDYYDTDILTLNVPAGDENIKTIRNNILSIDETDAKCIQITVIAE